MHGHFGHTSCVRTSLGYIRWCWIFPQSSCIYINSRSARECLQGPVNLWHSWILKCGHSGGVERYLPVVLISLRWLVTQLSVFSSVLGPFVIVSWKRLFVTFVRFCFFFGLSSYSFTGVVYTLWMHTHVSYIFLTFWALSFHFMVSINRIKMKFLILV